MKIIVYILFVFSAASFAQQADSIKVSEDVYECVDQVYDSPEGIKLLVQRLLSNREYLREVHRELLKDPETKKMIQDLMHKNREIMNEGMNRKDNENDEDPEKKKVLEGKADLMM